MRSPLRGLLANGATQRHLRPRSAGTTMNEQRVERSTSPCDYLAGVWRLIALGLVPAGKLSHLTIEHDPWCPVLGGAGTKRCEPAFYLNGERVTFPAEGENLT